MIPSPPEQTHPRSEDAYIEQTTLLREEINAAMLAISGNSLQVLEESLWRQEVLCTSLRRLLQALQGEAIDSASMARIRSSTLALHQVNRTYANLVQQSRMQAEVLYGLCLSLKEASCGEILNRSVRLDRLEA